jgi:hypothetical protein
METVAECAVGQDIIIQAMDTDVIATAAFTIYVRYNVPLFADEAVVKKYETILLAKAEQSRCEAPAYVFMPNKCYLLLQGKGGLANLVSTIRDFRRGAGYWFSRAHCDAEWPGNHGSNVQTTQQEILQYARHILNAPVRMGIVDDWKQYRYRGSTLYHLDSWL